MNYLFLIPVWSYRGGERIFLDLAEKIQKNNNKVVVIAGRKDLKDYLSYKNLDIIYPKRFNGLLQNNYFYFLFSWIFMLYLALNSKVRFEKVITESNQCLWVAAILSIFKPLEIIWYVMAYENKHFSNKLLNLGYELTFGLFERLSVLRVSEFWALAPRVKREVEGRYKITARVVMPEIKKFYPSLKHKNLWLKKILSKKNTLFLPGSLHWKKNQKLAIYLVSKFKFLKLVIAGKGEDLNTLQNLSMKLNVKDRVYFCGVLNRHEMAYCYKNSLVTLICSLNDNEGLSLTALESLAYFRPVIVSKYAGVAEIIKGRKNVYIAQPDVSHFKSQLKKLYNE